jgi:hypothetical protein
MVIERGEKRRSDRGTLEPFLVYDRLEDVPRCASRRPKPATGTVSPTVLVMGPLNHRHP